MLVLLSLRLETQADRTHHALQLGWQEGSRGNTEWRKWREPGRQAPDQ
jgi:hypothetical protein